ncbi:MAG: hypothetical protein SVO01_02735, partial [Thermotogota bacterium]|nr:hypothetical protein [Thermotogota bacterium]
MGLVFISHTIDIDYFYCILGYTKSKFLSVYLYLLSVLSVICYLLVGVLLVINKKNNDLFNENDRLLLSGISNQIAIILDNIRLMSE